MARMIKVEVYLPPDLRAKLEKEENRSAVARKALRKYYNEKEDE